MDGQSFESSHSSNVRRLLAEHRLVSVEEVLFIYDSERQRLEADSIVPNYLPVLSYRSANELLRERYKHCF